MSGAGDAALIAIADSVEEIVNILQGKQEPTNAENTIYSLYHGWFGSLHATADHISKTLDDPTLDIIQKHQELRKLVIRLQLRAAQVDVQFNPKKDGDHGQVDETGRGRTLR